MKTRQAMLDRDNKNCNDINNIVKLHDVFFIDINCSSSPWNDKTLPLWAFVLALSTWSLWQDKIGPHRRLLAQAQGSAGWGAKQLQPETCTLLSYQYLITVIIFGKLYQYKKVFMLLGKRRNSMYISQLLDLPTPLVCQVDAPNSWGTEQLELHSQGS